jgi:nucleoside-diphosphate-sugar epimerase
VSLSVFLTGASGYLGGALVDELLAAGHRVAALTRAAESAARLAARGVAAVVGTLAEPAGWRDAAAGHDGYVHLAQDAAARDRLDADRVALDTLAIAARRGAGGPASLVYTSNAFVLGDQGGAMLHEDDPLPGGPRWGGWRLDAERHALSLGDETVAAAVVRPGQVFGGDGGTLPLLFESAVRDGAAAHVGDGDNRWSMVHRGDLARLYRLVVERRARGAFHGVDETPVRVRDLARAASEAAGAGGRTRAVPLDEARAALGGFADMLALDVVVGCRRSRALGWRPEAAPWPAAAADAFAEWRASRGGG